VANSLVLEMFGIIKGFAGVQALKGVNFSLARGEVHALVGENGAGKSTLVKILSGALQPDAGEIHINGKLVNFKDCLEAHRAGVATIYQELSLIPHLTVAENLFLGREPTGLARYKLDYQRMFKEAREVLQWLGLDIDPKTEIDNLSLAQQIMVEVGRALFCDAKIVLVDEPSAALTPYEADTLFSWISNQKEKGISFVYISHRLEELFSVGDRVSVLRDGCMVGTLAIEDIDLQQLVFLMVGRSMDERFAHREPNLGEVVLSVKHLSDGGLLKDINFELHKGEILGFAGLVGAGKTELAKTIFGATRKAAGEVWLLGETIEIQNPQDSIRKGIGLVPEDRRSAGLISNLSVLDNIGLAALPSFSRYGRINWSCLKMLVKDLINKLGIKTPSPNQIVANLSGGNQQKVVLAKWLATKCKVLIFDEPTRGIDVGAKAEIYNLMNELTSTGVAILLMSSELPEVLGMSDRVVVVRQGRTICEFCGSEASEEQVLAYASGAKENNHGKHEQ
jgi:ribose transport system ATP-binding protein